MMQAFQQELGYGTNNGSIPAATGAAAGQLLPASANAVTSGLYGLSNFQPTGGTQYNVDAASQYANNPAVSDMVTASMRDANQNYRDITAPGIDRNSAGGGNINSSTNGIAHGIVERGLAQKAGDISANLRGGLYQTGLSLAQQQAQNDNTTRLGALGALLSGGNNATMAGSSAGNASVNQAAGLFNIANTGASNINSGNQADLTNQLQAWQFGANSPFAALNNYFNIIGNKSWGSQGTGTSTTTSTPSPLSMIGSGIGMIGSLF